MQSGVCITKGEEIRIDAYISGSPYPKVTWMRNEEDVTKEPTKKIIPVVKKKKKTKALVCSSKETMGLNSLFLYIFFKKDFFSILTLFGAGSRTRGGVCDSHA